MATYVNVTVGGDGLLNRDRQLRQATRFDALDRQKDKEVEKEKGKQEQEPQGKSLKPLPYKREPAAHRYSVSGMFALAHSAKYDSAAKKFRVTVSVPDTSHTLTVERSIDRPMSPPARPPSYSPDSGGRDKVAAYGRVFVYDEDTSDPANPLAWQMRYDTGSGDKDQYYAVRYTEPVRSSDRTTGYGTYDRYIHDLSTYWVLPVNTSKADKGAVFIYLLNYIKCDVVYRFDTRVKLTSVNERIVPYFGVKYAWGEEHYEADWDASGTVSDTLVHQRTDSYTEYEIFAFYVSENGVRELTVPSTLAAHIREIAPPASVNGTISRANGIVSYDRYVATSRTTFVTITDSNYVRTAIDVPSFNQATYDASTRYKTRASTNLALAKHFGMGNLTTSGHGGDFFTPAVFRYVVGPMTLDTSQAFQYAYMRSSYYQSAPRDFYGMCARAGSCQVSGVTEFDKTSTQPEAIYRGMDPLLFRRNSATDVKIGQPTGRVLYIWDWGDPALCRGRCIALGFSAADLRP